MSEIIKYGCLYTDKIAEEFHKSGEFIERHIEA